MFQKKPTLVRQQDIVESKQILSSSSHTPATEQKNKPKFNTMNAGSTIKIIDSPESDDSREGMPSLRKTKNSQFKENENKFKDKEDIKKSLFSSGANETKQSEKSKNKPPVPVTGVQITNKPPSAKQQTNNVKNNTESKESKTVKNPIGTTTNSKKPEKNNLSSLQPSVKIPSKSAEKIHKKSSKANSTSKKKKTKATKKSRSPVAKISSNILQSPEEQIYHGKNLIMNLELLNKNLFESEEVLKEQNKLLSKFNNLKQYINSFDYNLDKIVIKAENDDFTKMADSMCGNISDITDKIQKYNQEIKNIQCKKILIVRCKRREQKFEI